MNNIPYSEPERQNYFIGKCAMQISDMEHKLNRKLTVCINTFGCQMNAKDSEKLLGILTKIGYVETDSENADLVLYNTCTIRENANLKVYGHLGYLKNLKKQNPNMIIVLCGCMMQEKHVIEKIKKNYSHVDIIFGTHNIYKLAELLYKKLSENTKMLISVLDSTEEIVENLPSVRKFPFKAGVNIMYGCNNFCSYCIVPYVRGRERSRNPQDIIDEVKELAADGVVEIMLLGQNVNSYGQTSESPYSFAKLLTEVEKVDGIRRIRFMTSHPKDLSDELIEVMRSSKKICSQLHLPLQSGSTEILKKMNRKYTKEQYLDLVERIRTKIPDISLSTDIIVGFPGETEKDFLETIDAIKKVEFDSAFTFIYSKRSGTPAASMTNQVSETDIKDRFDRLLKEINSISSKRTDRYTGRTMEVLAEEINAQDNGLITGRLDNNTIVHFKGNPDLIGKIVNVKLDRAKGFYYLGTLI